MPTLLEYVGINTPLPSDLPGRSFNNLLNNKPLDHEQAIVVYDEFGPTRMIRNREWKYVHR